jgi:hypothetical protein
MSGEASHDQAFRLQPFETGSPWDQLSLEARLRLEGKRLSIDYRLTGELALVRIPGPEARPERRDGLWQSTCLEFFVAVAGAEPYWEFNLSPAGHWNVYRLDGYRLGLRPESAFCALPFTVTQTAEALELSVSSDLSVLMEPQQPLELAISAVVELQSGAFGYWALAHRGPEPDFHRRDGFLFLPGLEAAEPPFPG